MSTDEEYLDNLLKTMSTDDTEENDDNKIMSLMNETDPMENKTAPMRKEVFSDIRPEDEIPSADKKGDEKKPVVDESWLKRIRHRKVWKVCLKSLWKRKKKKRKDIFCLEKR